MNLQAFYHLSFILCLMSILFSFLLFFKILFINFLQRGERREKERERNISVWLPLTHPQLEIWPATLAYALVWESNQRRFGSQASAQFTNPHQPGLIQLSLGYSAMKNKPQILVTYNINIYVLIPLRVFRVLVTPSNIVFIQTPPLKLWSLCEHAIPEGR